ncbi:hypothetical protein TIFTF001_023243 [Ficus carica]|uniref:Uncharacterized protein n=1 Tax=Ficus carica TaxID=3494 RepID=A0AA88AEA0_FICCA|nr:hypothetical protein TIFTF001_023243 [Ficus carica]
MTVETATGAWRPWGGGARLVLGGWGAPGARGVGGRLAPIGWGALGACGGRQAPSSCA